MLQQLLVALPEGVSITPRRHGRCQAVGAMDVRHSAQFPQGVLQSGAEALEAFGEADRAGLPVGEGEHEVVDEVGEGDAVDSDVQVGAVGKVGGGQSCGLMDLVEEDFLDGSVQGAELLDASLQGAELSVGKASGMFSLQPVEQGPGFESWVEGQEILDLVPDGGEGVGSGFPVMFHTHLAGKFAESSVLACGLVVDARLGGSLSFVKSAEVEASESQHLLIGDHPKPPCGKGFRIG